MIYSTEEMFLSGLNYINTLKIACYHLTTGNYAAALAQTNVIESAADDFVI